MEAGQIGLIDKVLVVQREEGGGMHRQMFGCARDECGVTLKGQLGGKYERGQAMRDRIVRDGQEPRTCGLSGELGAIRAG